jgi:hypothetical protein
MKISVIARHFIRVVQLIGGLGTLVAHCGEYTYINIYEALLQNDTADDITNTFVPEVPTVVWFLVSALSIVASLSIAIIAYRKVTRIKRIERTIALCMVLLWGIAIGATFALDGQFYTYSDADPALDTSDSDYYIETTLIAYIDACRALALLALSGWTFGLLFSLLSDCFSDCRRTHRKTHDSEKGEMWPVNATAPPEYSERYGQLPHHTSLKPPTNSPTTSSFRNSFYKTPMEVATRSNSPMALSHYEDMSSTHSWESSSPSSPRTTTPGLPTPPFSYAIPDHNRTATGVRPFSGIPVIRVHPDGSQEDVSPTSFAYLITNPKPVASVRRANSLS